MKPLQAKVLAKNDKIGEIEINGQKITLPVEYLPNDVESGQNISINIFNPNPSTIQEKKLAKAILEEILNGN